MTRRALAVSVSCAAMMSAMGLQPTVAAPWTRGYVVGFYEYAFRYGARADYARGSEISPGVDCPHGSTVSFSNPTQIGTAISTTPWRTKQEVDDVLNAQNRDRTVQGAGGGYFGIWSRAAAFRGYKREIETYVNPFAASDPGEPEVTSRIAEGFNLDGKIKASDFVSPDGERGIDNNLYRAWGCDNPWRGNADGTLDLRANDKMRGGLYTVVIRLSGNKDPMNDDAATLEVGYSPDKIVMDALGKTGVDYSYRIIKGSQYTKLKAKIKNGVVETEQASEIHMPQIAWFEDQNRDADFHNGKIRLVMNTDGTATGLVGGYRNWRDLYAQDTYAQDGGQQGVREHEDHVALYYALRRNADGMLNPKTGKYDGISSAYSLQLAQAYVVDPATPMGMPTVEAGDLQPLYSYDSTFAAFVKGTESGVPQEVPAGSNEHQVEEGANNRGFKKYWTDILMKGPGPGKTMEDYKKLWAEIPTKRYSEQSAENGPGKRLASAAADDK